MYELEITLPKAKINKFIKGGAISLSPSDLTRTRGQKVKMIFKTMKHLKQLKDDFANDRDFQATDGSVDMLDSATGGSLRGLTKVLKTVKNVANDIADTAKSVNGNSVMDALEGGKLSSKQRNLNRKIKKGLEKAFNVVKKEAKKAYVENQDELKGIAKDLAVSGLKYADGSMDKQDVLNDLKHSGKKIGYMTGRQALDRTNIMDRNDFNHGQYKKVIPPQTLDYADNDYNPLEEMDPEFNGKGMKRRRYGKGLGGMQLINNPIIQGQDMKDKMARVRSFKKGGSILPLGK